MRELIAELPALSVAIPAFSVLLPLISVLILWAVFHWVFLPARTPDQINSNSTTTTPDAQDLHYEAELPKAMHSSGTVPATTTAQAVPPERARKPDLSNLRNKTPFERSRGNWGFTRKPTTGVAPDAGASGVTAVAASGVSLAADTSHRAATNHGSHSKRSPSAISKQARQAPTTESSQKVANSRNELSPDVDIHNRSDQPESSGTNANPGVAGSAANQKIAAQFAARKDSRTKHQVGANSIAEGTTTGAGKVGGNVDGRGNADEQAKSEIGATHTATNLSDQGDSEKARAPGQVTDPGQNNSSAAGQHQSEAQDGIERNPVSGVATASISPLPASTQETHTSSDIKSQTQPAQQKPKYKTAAKTRHIPASIEAQLQLRSPLTNKPTPASNTGEDLSQQSEQKHALQLAEKNRLIEDLQKKLATLEADTQKSITQRSANQRVDQEQQEQPLQTTNAENDSAIRNLLHPHNKTSPSIENSNPAARTQTPAAQASRAQNTSALHIAGSSKDQSQHHDKQPGLTASTTNTRAADEDKATYKHRYQLASEKLAINEHKIDQLRSTVNQLQASGLVELQKISRIQNHREPLLSKVRVLIEK